MSDDLVLASGSGTRGRLLEVAGVPFRQVPPAVDESEIKESLKVEGVDAMEAAEALAEVKARQISLREPAALVVGADQMLDCEGHWFDKPADAARVADHLRRLAGRRHRLSTAAVICLAGERIWHRRSEAWLTMRRMTPAFINDYVARFGERAKESVGAYQLEAEGVQLFTAVEGDHFTIQGLPLLPLLDFLRDRGILQR